MQASYEERFKTLPAYLDVMRRTWNEEPVYGNPISVWPGTEGGPPVLLGAWRSERWINLAANQCQGWISSGIHSSWDDLELGVKMYRNAGGGRAVLANVFTDFGPNPESGPSQHVPKVTLHCGLSEARERLRRMADIGLDDVLLVPPPNDPAQLERMSELL